MRWCHIGGAFFFKHGRKYTECSESPNKNEQFFRETAVFRAYFSLTAGKRSLCGGENGVAPYAIAPPRRTARARPPGGIANRRKRVIKNGHLFTPTTDDRTHSPRRGIVEEESRTVGCDETPNDRIWGVRAFVIRRA